MYRFQGDEMSDFASEFRREYELLIERYGPREDARDYDLALAVISGAAIIAQAVRELSYAVRSTAIR